MAPTRVILMSCGSYNPPTNMHLRMFEIARDHLHRMGTHVVVGGVISPVHDAYAKKELASATHRCAMLRLALQNNDWIRLSTWETRQNCWTKTRLCLQHHQNLLNSILSNSNDIKHHMQIEDVDWIPENVRNNLDNTPIQIKLLCGADLLESFGICGLWLEEDIDAIVGEHGLVVITREGSTNPNKFIYDSDVLSKHMHNICIVTEWIPNEVSSTRIRRALKRSESVRYLVQDSVIDYIYKNEIYDTKTVDMTIKLELPSPNANNYLHIEPRYLNAFLTPSPSDVTMGSPSPIEIMSAASIDVPDAVLCKNLQNVVGAAEARERFISALTVDNGNVRHVASRAPAYPGQAKQIVVASENGVVRIVDEEVGGPLDESTASKLRQPGPSTSGERALERDHRSRSATVEGATKGNIHVGQGEISDFRSSAGTPGVDLTRASTDRLIVVKIQPGSSNSSEPTVEEGSGRSTVGARGKETLDSSDGRGVIVNIQPGTMSSDEVSAKGLRFKTEIVDVSLASIDLADNREAVMRIQCDQSGSSEPRPRECCWPTGENDAAEGDDREIAEVASSSSSANDYSRRIADKANADRTGLGKIASERGSAPIVQSGFRDGEMGLRRELAEPSLGYAGDIVQIQPGLPSRNTAAGRDHNLRIGKTKATPDGRKFSAEHLDRAGKDWDVLASEGFRRGSDVSDRGIGSKREAADFELDDRARHLEIKTTTSSLNVSMTSLDGRHECALSDFSVDKEDYRLSQYGSEEDEEEDKLLYGSRLNLANYQREDMTDNTINFADDSKIGANIQIASTMISKSYEDISKDPPATRTDEKSPALPSEEGRTNAEGGNQRTEASRTTLGVDKDNRAERRSESDAYFLERRTIACDPNSEIDGKYLKSVVNSRKSPRKVKESQTRDVEPKEPKNRQTAEVAAGTEGQGVNDQKIFYSGEASQSSSRTSSTKVKSSTKVGARQTGGENDRETGKVSQKTSTSGAKSPKKLKEKQAHRESGEAKDLSRFINDRVISQLEEVFQKSAKKSSTKTIEGSKKVAKETKDQTHRHTADNQQSKGEEVTQHSSKITFVESPRKAQGQKKAGDRKVVEDGKAKRDFNEIKDVYTRKVRRYNMPLQGSLDSMIASEESFAPKPKKDDTFSKKSKSYESIKRIQEVFLGAPGKMSSSGSQLDMPDEFCSICCYMNEITFRTEEEVSSPNQETFYTMRSACSSLADDDDSAECDICSSLNQQESSQDALEGKLLMDSAHGEIPCELCRICGEVDGSYDQSAMIPADRYAFRLVEPSPNDDDSFEIENCGFQSGTESADDRSRVSEKESVKEPDKSKLRSLFVHGSSKTRDQPRELYFIPKDEIAILTSGTRKGGRKGSLFRKKETLSVRDNRRYSSADSLQLAKLAKTSDKPLKVAKNPALVASADNLQVSSRRSSRRSKSLQRPGDDVRRSSLTDNLHSLTKCLAGNEEDMKEALADAAQKPNTRDKEAVKMILTQHGIKIISERETAL